jgi:hypothetical protein
VREEKMKMRYLVRILKAHQLYEVVVMGKNIRSAWKTGLAKFRRREALGRGLGNAKVISVSEFPLGSDSRSIK